MQWKVSWCVSPWQATSHLHENGVHMYNLIVPWIFMDINRGICHPSFQIDRTVSVWFIQIRQQQTGRFRKICRKNFAFLMERQYTCMPFWNSLSDYLFTRFVLHLPVLVSFRFARFVPVYSFHSPYTRFVNSSNIIYYLLKPPDRRTYMYT
jgi:hypothetical protein